MRDRPATAPPADPEAAWDRGSSSLAHGAAIVSQEGADHLVGQLQDLARGAAPRALGLALGLPHRRPDRARKPRDGGRPLDHEPDGPDAVGLGQRKVEAAEIGAAVRTHPDREVKAIGARLVDGGGWLGLAESLLDA